MEKAKRIYLDYASSTPIDTEVSSFMHKSEKLLWANPSSLHQEGELAKNALIEARISVAKNMCCKKSEIFFTSGGTESLNLAIFGVVDAFFGKNKIIPHIIVTVIEHSAVINPINKLLKDKKAEVSFVSCNEEGLINPESILKEIKNNTALVIVMHANNEIGVCQPVHKISSYIKKYREQNKTNHPYFLVDACQSTVFEDVSFERFGADMIVIDGIKIYGPRSSGILAVKTGVEINPIIFGGGQESGLRSGTEDVIKALGFAKSLEIASKRRKQDSQRIIKLRDYAINKILKEVKGSSLNGSLSYRLPNNINICFKKDLKNEKSIDSEFLVIQLDVLGFAVSTGSACQNISSDNSSRVLEALGDKTCASSSIRITLGRNTTKSDLDKLISPLKKIIN